MSRELGLSGRLFNIRGSASAANRSWTPLAVAVLAAAILGVASPAGARQITDNLLGHWALNEGSGNTISDSTGNGLTGGNYENNLGCPNYRAD